MSFREKTIVGIALIESVLLLVLVISGLQFLSESNALQLKQRANSTASLFAAATKDAVLSTDLATLESTVAEILEIPDVVYARVIGNGIVLAEKGEPALLDAERTADDSLDRVTDRVFDVKHTISIDGRAYGTVELGLSTSYVDALLSRATWSAFTLAGAEIILVAIFSFVLGTFLTRQLALLRKAAEKISSEGPGTQVEVLSNDEIGDVARSFNAMSQNLHRMETDVRTSLEAQQDLLNSANRNEAFSKAILAASLDGVICIDSSSRVFECNEHAATIFGWTRDELIDEDMSEIIIPEKYREAHKTGMKHYLETGEGPVLGKRVELEALNKEGKVFPIEINISPIDSGESPLFAAYIRDLSITKAREAEQKLAHSRAEQANEAKSRFLATMSHEIRSPLNAVIAMSALLMETKLDQKQREIASHVNDGGEILSLLLNDVLDFSKIESGRLSLHEGWFDLKLCVERSINLYSHQASLKHLELTSDFSPQLDRSYWGDQTRVLQILINLLSNAIKFTDRGRINLLMDKSDSGKGVVIRVTDTGIGIPEDQMEHIFNEFAQVDSEDNRKFGGTGLGLSIVQGLTKLMNGRVYVTNAEEQGACFVVELPLAGGNQDNGGSEAESPKTPELTFEGFDVLLAEDSITNRKVIEATLARLKLKVDSAENGAEAVQMAQKKHYDLVLMDLAMPKMDGLEATREIRTGDGKSKNSKIIAITANAFEEDRENCIAAGMDDFISKPINISAFRDLAGRWLLASRSAQRPAVKSRLIDIETFNQLYKDTGPAVLPDIFKLFVAECRERLVVLQGGYEEGAWQVLLDEAHALKSSSGSFGAIKLQAIAREIEETAKSRNQAHMDELFSRFEELLNESLSALSSLIEQKENE